MKLTEAIVLAGGSGTRLKSTVPALPKCLAPVNGKPFLGYLLAHLVEQGFKKFIFALGIQSEQVIQYLDKSWQPLLKEYSTENIPLGTGGAVLKSLEFVRGNHVLVTNGDTIFKASLDKAFTTHENLSADCTILLLPMEQPDRYGTVELAKNGLVTAFREKQRVASGLVNAGSYILQKDQFTSRNWPDNFSFEKDYLEPGAGKLKIAGDVQQSYFIDIGIPADYKRAQNEWIYF